MAIVAFSGSWKETRNEMMRKYLKAEKISTEAESAAVQRKNYATYNDFLRAFTLVALRILGVTDRIMSKYFLRQFSEFEKDKILSAYQQTSKFEYTKDVDFNTITDLAEKTMVTEMLALLKEGEVIDLTGKTKDKVKKGIESMHERVHGVDSKMERVENVLLVMQAQVSRPVLPPQETVVPAAVANQGFGRRDPANERCRYCTMIGQFVRVCPRLNHDMERQRCRRSLKGEILGPQGKRVNWNSPGGLRQAVILLTNLDIASIEAEPVAEIVWDQPRGRGPQANFILEGNGQDRVNITTRQTGAEKKLIQDTVMKELAGTSADQQETKAEEQEKVYGKGREEEPVDKVTAAKKKFRYQIPILTSPEIDGTLSKLLGTMISVSFQTMLQASPRLLKGLRQLLTQGSVRKYKPVGKKAKPVSILVETSKEEALEKEEEVMRVIRERRATEGHRIPDEVAETMKIGVEGFLTTEETQLIRRACQEFHLAFAFNDHQKGRLDAKLIPPVKIYTVEHDCWNDKGSAYEFGIAAEVTDLLRAKIDSFVVEPTASPYAHKWFIFRKPNKTLKWIQNLQKLNVVTIRDASSLPQADLLAESHAGRSIYSLIDLYSGYDKLSLDARDRPYTAMHTPVGQLQMQVTPMGFTNAVAEAQRRMLAVAGDMFPKKCEPYINDNPIKGTQNKDETEVESGVRKFVWDHLQIIKDLLQRFLVYNITASGPKSILAVPEVTILGFRCGAYGRRPDPAKTDKISQWPTPLHTTTEVRAFLGVVGFWRIFIKRFAKIAEPIRAMIREGGTMEWTEDREAAAQTLKDILSSDQVTLAAPCFNDEFDYKVKRITGLRNRADGLSRVCITPEGIEDEEPIDAFLEHEGGTLVVDNEMADSKLTTGPLLIQTLEKGAPTVVAELREGSVTTFRRKEENDSWGTAVGPKEELMAMVIEGGRDAVMTLAETWAQREWQYLVNQTQEEQDVDQKER
ncbi:hypothetical protein CBR_g31078 [Chara braunii]|uniref:Reverse transcriptase domain-containing protein n=1 Tax=Chara braunii TaxID=69332 RepID=A0A388LE89_CHABU|nr:hypothetical protein CBR_g31078 [Chara braunii]|eukprot:GBG80618.1 hypothetical protein CBR_g31078 [Chara braunii]